MKGCRARSLWVAWVSWLAMLYASLVEASMQEQSRLKPDKPAAVRGLYLTAWTAGSSQRISELLALARCSDVNAFVIDIKDATGYISHRTRVPLAHQIGATGQLRIGNLKALLARLKQHNIYPIARLVVFKDPILVNHRPDLSIRQPDGGIWRDQNGELWLNPYQEAVWEYHLELAREVAKLGFAEIQWDYVRFPDATKALLSRARYPGKEGRTRTQAIKGFLQYTRDRLAPLGVTVTADVFGLTTSVEDDLGIGQHWPTLITEVDALHPMVYPSHYPLGAFGISRPNAQPYQVVYQALQRAKVRSRHPDAGQIRPWLQDFTLGSPRYQAEQVRAQIKATYDAGIQGWLLWNPRSRYTRGALMDEKPSLLVQQINADQRLQYTCPPS